MKRRVSGGDLSRRRGGVADRRLASAAIARDPDAFELVAGGAARINPVMDVWLRLRGKQGGIRASRRDPSEATG